MHKENINTSLVSWIKNEQDSVEIVPRFVLFSLKRCILNLLNVRPFLTVLGEGEGKKKANNQTSGRKMSRRQLFITSRTKYPLYLKNLCTRIWKGVPVEDIPRPADHPATLVWMEHLNENAVFHVDVWELSLALCCLLSVITVTTSSSNWIITKWLLSRGHVTPLCFASRLLIKHNDTTRIFCPKS